MKTAVLFRPFIFIASTTLISSCAMNSRTLYGPTGESGGYADSKLNDHVSVARFSGNEFTHPQDAKVFSAFRAQEVCRKNAHQFARIFSQNNLSQTQTSRRTAKFSHHAPLTFNGTSTSNGSFNPIAFQTHPLFNDPVTGANTSSTSPDWNETYVSPVFETYYQCSHSARGIGVQFKPLDAQSAQAAKDYTHDSLGALEITEIADNSPAKDKLKVGDIVIQVNDERVESNAQITAAIDSTELQNEVHFHIVRDGKPMYVACSTIDVTNQMEQEAAQIVNAGCAAPENKDLSLCANRLPASR
jgi:hypothetical protein